MQGQFIPLSGCVIAIRLTPKSSKNQIQGWMEDAQGNVWLKVCVTAPPEDGKANEALLRLLADEWNVRISELEIESGHTSRQKRIKRK
jgi:uncharacterized protein (TIGR00251 family)